MSQTKPVTLTTISSTTTRKDFARIIRKACKEKTHFVVERGGLPVVVILSVTEYEALTKALER